MAQRILEHLRDGISLGEMAVLYRAHYQAMEVQMELTRRGIPFELRSGLRFFEQAHIKDTAAYLRILSNPRDEMAWRRVLGLCDRVGKVTADKIWRSLSAQKDPLAAFLNGDVLAKAGKACQPGLERCRDLLRNIAALCLDQETGAIIEYILRNGYSDYLETVYTDYQGRVEDVAQLANFSSRFSSLTEFLNEMALLTSVGDDERDEQSPGDKVILSTIHQAKGLEWQVVFLVSCGDGMIPLYRALNDPEGEEEERRLFYVATTRAKDHLYLSYPVVDYSRRDGYVPVRPSRFINELTMDHLHNLEDMPFEHWQVSLD